MASASPRRPGILNSNSVLGVASSEKVWLYYGVRNGSEHIMKGHLQALAERHDNLHLHVCYSTPEPR
ncbi:MAG: hypothetical protein R3E46_14720 [Sedimenticolaceae bacterium]